jgi:hypothetical protein
MGAHGSTPANLQVFHEHRRFVASVSFMNRFSWAFMLGL